MEVVWTAIVWNYVLIHQKNNSLIFLEIVFLTVINVNYIKLGKILFLAVEIQKHV